MQDRMITFRNLLVLGALVLVGAGCKATVTGQGDIPTEPPAGQAQLNAEASEMMEGDVMVDDEGAMMDGKEGTEAGTAGSSDTEHSGAMMEDDEMMEEGAMMDDEKMTGDDGTQEAEPESAPSSAKPYYLAYTEAEYDAALAAKRPVLLYFWAAWCPICRAEEPGLRQIVENADVPVAGFRVDFDTETEMKKRFSVPYQHTTVILDVRGNESARFTGPVAEATLVAAIEAAAK